MSMLTGLDELAIRESLRGVRTNTLILEDGRKYLVCPSLHTGKVSAQEHASRREVWSCDLGTPFADQMAGLCEALEGDNHGHSA